MNKDDQLLSWYYTHRALLSLIAYPQLADSVPSYLLADSGHIPTLNAIKMLSNGDITIKGLLYGIEKKYPYLYEDVLHAVDDTETVPRESWARYQIDRLKKVFDES
jgi:hypothetical protein